MTVAKGRRPRADKAGKECGLTAKDARRMVMPLSAREVCDMIKACHQANVSSFEYAGLRVVFGKSLDEQTDVTSEAPAANQPRVPRPQPQTEEELAAARRRLAEISASQEAAKLESALEEEAFELEQMKITDPERYEDIVANRKEIR